MSLIGCHVNDGQSIFVCKSDSNTQAIYFVFLKGKNETLSIRARLQKTNCSGLIQMDTLMRVNDQRTSLHS